MEKTTLEFVSREQQRSEYDWAYIYRGSLMVGKCRGLMEGCRFTVFSVNIFPEFQKNGYGTDVIEILKKQYPVIIADSVRPTARTFWAKVGFVDALDGNFIYRRSL